MDPTAQDRAVQEVRIMQKVNRVHREAFIEKYPNQVEHCLRLVMERLQAGLDKRVGIDIADTDTWLMSTQEIQDLSQAAHLLNDIRKGL